MSKFKVAAAAVALSAASGAANALPYLDTQWDDTYLAPLFTKIPPTYTFTHDLTDDPTNEFRSLVDGYFPPDIVESATLTLFFYDDTANWRDSGALSDAIESASINPENGPFLGFVNNSFSSGEITGLLAGGTTVTRDLTYDGLFGPGTATLTAFALDGKLGISISATTGDFYFGGAKLVAQGQTVPVPGALALLGIGALGLGLTMRRKSGK